MPESNEHLANFTCRYLSFIDTKVAHLVYYNDLNSAIQSVEDGHSWGVISMNQNFTQNLYERVLDSMSNTDLNQVDVDLMEKSSIKVHMDVTNQHIAFTLQLKFVEAFEAFTKQLVSFYYDLLSGYFHLRFILRSAHFCANFDVNHLKR